MLVFHKHYCSLKCEDVCTFANIMAHHTCSQILCLQEVEDEHICSFYNQFEELGKFKHFIYKPLFLTNFVSFIIDCFQNCLYAAQLLCLYSHVGFPGRCPIQWVLVQYITMTGIRFTHITMSIIRFVWQLGWQANSVI